MADNNNGVADKLAASGESEVLAGIETESANLSPPSCEDKMSLLITLVESINRKLTVLCERQHDVLKEDIIEGQSLLTDEVAKINENFRALSGKRNDRCEKVRSEVREETENKFSQVKSEVTDELDRLR